MDVPTLPRLDRLRFDLVQDVVERLDRVLVRRVGFVEAELF